MSQSKDLARAAALGRKQLKALLDEGDLDQLTLQAKEFSSEFPTSPWPMWYLAQGLSLQQNPDDARHALAVARERGLRDAPWYETRMAMAISAKDWPEIATLAETLSELDSSEGGTVLSRLKSRFRIPYCEALVETGRAEQVSRMIDDLAETSDDRPWITRAKFRALTAIHDINDLAGACEAWVTRPNAKPGHGQLLRLMSLHDPDMNQRAQELLKRLYDAEPNSPLVQNALHAMQMQPDETGELVRKAWIAKMKANQATTVAQKTTIAFQTMAHGSGWDPDPYIKALKVDFLDREVRRPLIDFSQDTDVHQSEVGDNGQTALVFGRLGLPQIVVDAYFALEGTTAIFLKDLRQAVFFTGVQSLGNSFEETAQGLQDLVSATKGDHLTVYGASSSGFPAMRFGTRLNAQRIIGISAATTGTAEFIRRSGDTRGKVLVKRLHPLFEQDVFCSRTTLENSPNNPRVDLVFGDRAQIDLPHAEEMRGAQNVHLHALPDCGEHPISLALLARGMLADVLAGRIEGNPGLLAG